MHLVSVILTDNYSFFISQSNRKFVQTESKQSITIKNTSTHLSSNGV